MGVRVSTLDKLVAQQRACLAKERIASKEKPDLDQLAASAKGVTEESSDESLAATLVRIDTANLLLVIAEEMIAGSFKSLPGPYRQTQAIMLMAISRGLLETSELGDEEVAERSTRLNAPNRAFPKR
jgi:hypothetical protein